MKWLPSTLGALAIAATVAACAESPTGTQEMSISAAAAPLTLVKGTCPAGYTLTHTGQFKPPWGYDKNRNTYVCGIQGPDRKGNTIWFWIDDTL